MNIGKIYTIKGMVCSRCISELQKVLEQHHLKIRELALGRVELCIQNDTFNETFFSGLLNSLGFTLGRSKNDKIIEQVKIAVHNYSGLEWFEEKKKLSEFLSEALNMSYDNISSIFSAHEKITIENYLITHRLGRVKQLLKEDSLTLTEIAHRTGFSSVHHLSKQFKDSTGISPTEFRKRLEQLKIV